MPKKAPPHAFKPGQSGNPAGKPKGAKTWRSKLRDQLESGSDEILASAIDKAKNGDHEMQKFLLDRMIPKHAKDTVYAQLVLKGEPEDKMVQITKALEAHTINLTEAKDYAELVGKEFEIKDASRFKYFTEQLKEKYGIELDGRK